MIEYDATEQPLPTADVTMPIVHTLVANDIRTRMAVGIVRYGQALRPFNGRDALLDAYEEALDLCCYLKQAMLERDNPHAAPSTEASS